MSKKVPPILEKDPSIDALAAWPFPDSTLYFFSGSNSPTEMQVLVERGLNIGVAIPDLSQPALATLVDLGRTGRLGISRVFVDSGAFGEVKFTGRGPSWPEPITDAEWHDRLGKYLLLARALGYRAHLVAPDQVANQMVTLERLVRYAHHMAQCAAAGSQILVPVQKGAVSMTDFWHEEMKILDSVRVPRDLYYPAVPLKKDATSLSELQEFVKALTWHGRVRRPRLHFLGRGVYSPEYRETFAVAMAACPDLQVSSDSVRQRAMVGSKRAPGIYGLAKRVLEDLGVDPSERVHAGLHMALDQEELAQMIDALHTGWYDSELFSSSQEQLAWLAAGSPEPDDWDPMWAEMQRRMR